MDKVMSNHMTTPTFILGFLDEVKGCSVLDTAARILVFRLHGNNAAGLLAQLTQLNQRGPAQWRRVRMVGIPDDPLPVTQQLQ